MRPLRTRLQEARRRLGLPWDVLERDYLLSARARDYYDLWRVLGAYEDRMDLSGFVPFLREKCAVRKVTFAGPDDFFQDTMLAHMEKTWDRWLGPLVPGLPSFQTVIGELRPRIAALVAPDR